jgi:hypothetical protein
MSLSMSGVREDSAMLRDIYRLDRKTRATAKEYAQYPLLVLPSTVSPEFKTYTGEKARAAGITGVKDHLIEAFTELPRKFAFIDMCNTDLYFVVNNKYVEEGKVYIEHFVRWKNANAIGLFAGSLDFGYSAKDEIFMILGMVKQNGVIHYGKKAMGEALRITGRTNKEFKNTATIVTAYATNNIACMAAWAREHDKYPVITRSTNVSDSQTQPHKRRDLPRLIYMNKLPSAASAESKGGHHASPRGHERRGHYKTLKHPKFKHHPKFGVPNGIYVRPAWVGPKETVHEGNRYTVIT